MHIINVTANITLEWVLAKINKGIEDETELKGFTKTFTKEDLAKVLESETTEIVLTRFETPNLQNTLVVFLENNDNLFKDLKHIKSELCFYFTHIDTSVVREVMATAFNNLPISSKQWIQIGYLENLNVKRGSLFRDEKNYSRKDFMLVIKNFAEDIFNIFCNLEKNKKLKPYREINQETPIKELGLTNLTTNALINAELNSFGKLLQKIKEKPNSQALLDLPKLGKKRYAEIKKILDFYAITV